MDRPGCHILGESIGSGHGAMVPCVGPGLAPDAACPNRGVTWMYPPPTPDGGVRACPGSDM
jgi:hypothetical protein